MQCDCLLVITYYLTLFQWMLKFCNFCALNIKHTNIVIYLLSLNLREIVLQEQKKKNKKTISFEKRRKKSLHEKKWTTVYFSILLKSWISMNRLEVAATIYEIKNKVICIIQGDILVKCNYVLSPTSRNSFMFCNFKYSNFKCWK